MNWETLFNVAAKLATETSTKYGPVAWDTMLWLVRVDRLAVLVPSILLLLVPLVYRYKYSARVRQWVADSDRFDDGPAMSRVGFWIMFYFTPTLIFGINTLNIWNWVGVIKPELYLAKQLVDKVI